MFNTQHDPSQSDCAPCEVVPFRRNHYFTGKLMTVHDFNAEQQYVMDKLRHHHQRLHGWGVVCGLEVRAHPQSDCRSRYVLVEPGTAIDCCGHEILIPDEQILDLNALPGIIELQKKADAGAHTLQICLRYRECPSEEIPVLYDDCGDANGCAPNRILESFELDAILDAKPEDTLHYPALKKKATTVALADLSRVAAHGNLMYLLVGDNVYKADIAAPLIAPPYPLAAKGMEIALSPSGDFLYVVTEAPAGSASGELQMVVLKTATLAPLYAAFDVVNTKGNTVGLAVAPDNRVGMLVKPSGDLMLWTEAELTGAAAPPARVPIPIIADLEDFAFSSDSKIVYAVGSTVAAIKQADLTTSMVTDLLAIPSGVKPSGIAVARSTGTDVLAVTDNADSTIHAFGLTPAALLGSGGLTQPPTSLAVSPGGRWAYVLELNGAKSFVQVVDLQRLALNQPNAVGDSIPTGDNSTQVVLTPGGAKLYVPFTGDATQVFDGGVVTIEIEEHDCEDILWRHLKGCPHCDGANCIVLATIPDYHLGDKLEDATDPPVVVAGSAFIDNKQGRHVLPSVSTLLEMIECLLNRESGGGAGTQGPPGPPGKDGKDGAPGANGTNGTDGKDGLPGIDGKDGVNGTNGKDGIDGKDGADGKDGVGLEPDLIRINALSWTHNQPSSLVNIIRTDINGNPLTDPATGKNVTTPEIIIGFNGKVQFSTVISEKVFEVSAPHSDAQANDQGFLCHCPIRGRVIAVRRTAVGPPGLITGAQEIHQPITDAVAFLLENATPIQRLIGQGGVADVWVRLRGDFVLDDSGKRAIDAEFVRGQLPTGDRPDGSDFGIQGGLFESWFFPKQGG